MDITKFKVTAVFFFSSGSSRKVDWVESRLIKKTLLPGKEVIEPLTDEEATVYLTKLLSETMQKKETWNTTNILNESVVVNMGNVEFFKLSLVAEEDKQESKVEEVTQELPPLPPLPPKTKSISDHPAYQPK